MVVLRRVASAVFEERLEVPKKMKGQSVIRGTKGGGEGPQT